MWTSAGFRRCRQPPLRPARVTSDPGRGILRMACSDQRRDVVFDPEKSLAEEFVADRRQDDRMPRSYRGVAPNALERAGVRKARGAMREQQLFDRLRDLL